MEEEKKKRGVVKGTVRGKYKPRQSKIDSLVPKDPHPLEVK